MAWRPRPASWPWLLVHEARLLWRMTGGARLYFLLAFAGLYLLLAHVAGWAVMRRFDLEPLLQARPGTVIFASLFAILMALSTAFGLAVSALFGRGDMDLLLSSPVPIRNVYAVRAIAVGLASVAMLGIFWMPFANMGPVHGKWGTLAAYPVLLAIGLLCAALAFAGTLGLVRLVGPRRAHVAAQVVGAFAGAFLIIAMQFESVLPESTRQGVHAWLASGESTAWFGPASFLTWPARAIFGDPLPFVAVTALCLGVFVMVVALTTRGFASAVQEQATVFAASRRDGGRTRAFRAGLARIVIAKEWRLIARDPTLIAKSLVQLLYFVPLILILARHAELAAFLAASLVMLASSLAGTLAWITVSGEEAPDLVGSAPIDAERVRWLKAAAALAPVAVVVIPFLAWYAAHSLRLFAILVPFVVAGVVSSAVIQVWAGRPAQARDLGARNRQDPLMNTVEASAAFGWALACYLAAAGYYAAAVPAAAFGFAGPTVAWFVGRARAGTA